MRIRLSYWHDGHDPGDIVDLPNEVVVALTLDGRVAEVLDDEVPAPDAPAPAEKTVPEPPRRRSRKSTDEP